MERDRTSQISTSVSGWVEGGMGGGAEWVSEWGSSLCSQEAVLAELEGRVQELTQQNAALASEKVGVARVHY